MDAMLQTLLREYKASPEPCLRRRLRNLYYKACSNDPLWIKRPHGNSKLHHLWRYTYYEGRDGKSYISAVTLCDPYVGVCRVPRLAWAIHGGFNLYLEDTTLNPCKRCKKKLDKQVEHLTIGEAFQHAVDRDWL